MNRIRPSYYDKFTCIADRCPITCCQEWKIGVDADTNRKWKKLLPPENVEPQRKNLSAYTTKKDGERVIGLTEDHKCPFLNSKKLCKLVVAYGDQVLSKTCTDFPREVHVFEQHEEENLMPCCPAVIDLLWESDREELFQIPETGEDGQLLFAIRREVLKMAVNAEENKLSEMLSAAFYILRELSGEIEEMEGEEAALALTAEYFSAENQENLKKAIREIPSDPLATMQERNELLQDLSINYRQEGLYTPFLEPLLEMAEELSVLYNSSIRQDGQKPGRTENEPADCSALRESIRQFADAFHPHEKLIKAWLFEELRSDLLLPDSSLEGMLIQLQWIAMEYSVICHSIFLTWQSHPDNITYESVKTAIVILSRMTGYGTDDIYEYLENSFESLVWEWGYFALIMG